MPGVSPSSDRPIHILLVEDNPGDVRLIEEAFTDARLANTLHVASDGTEALDFVYQRGEFETVPCPDLVLLDWHLPETSGETVLTTLKDDTDLKHIPVVVLSGSDAEADVVESYSSQANAYITKPVEPDSFIELIRSFNEFWFQVVRLPPSDDEP